MRRDWDDDRNVSGTDMMKVVVAIVKPKGKYIIYLFIYIKSFLSTWAAIDLYSHRYATMPPHWNQPNEASRDWWTQWVVNNSAVILIPWKNLNIGKIPESYKSTKGINLGFWETAIYPPLR